MNLQEIKKAVESGLTVHWKNELYQVFKEKSGSFFVVCIINGTCHGLIYKGTLQGNEKDFYLKY